MDQFLLKSTFTFANQLEIKQRHYCKIIEIQDTKLRVELLDVFPKTIVSVPYSTFGKGINAQQIKEIYKIDQLCHCVIVERTPSTQASLVKEAFIQAGYDMRELENLNGQLTQAQIQEKLE